MFRSRRRLRFRLALEFAAVAAVVNTLLFLVVIGVREDQFRSDFDRELLLRAREAGREAARELQRGEAITLEAIDEYEEGMYVCFEVHSAEGEVMGQTRTMVPLVLDPAVSALDATATAAPVFGTIAGDSFGDPSSKYRVVTVAVPTLGPRPPVVVHAASTLAPVQQAVLDVRMMLLMIVLPVATLAAGLAGWVISDRVFRRLGAITRAAHEIRAGDQRLPAPQAPDEIGEMVAEMNAMIERLERAFSAQKRFVLDVTHELKTPVSIMLAEAQLLSRRSPGLDPERFVHFVANVEEETRRLGQLAESLLTVVRTGHGPAFVAETLVPINEVVCEAAERWEVAGRTVGSHASLSLHESRQEGDDMVLGDHELLVTMLENLLSAISELSGPKRVLRVSVGRYNGTAEVGVEAIDPETNMPVSPRLSSARGHELKMAIVNGIAQLHAGSVKATGTRAVVKLPACVELPERENVASA